VTAFGDQCIDKNSLRFLSHIGMDSMCVYPLLVPIAKIATAGVVNDSIIVFYSFVVYFLRCGAKICSNDDGAAQHGV
jgi:hypothetical protein